MRNWRAFFKPKPAFQDATRGESDAETLKAIIQGNLVHHYIEYCNFLPEKTRSDILQLRTKILTIKEGDREPPSVFRYFFPFRHIGAER